MQSMTGFASVDGAAEGADWRWDARSVNGRGLEARLRLPPGWDAQEAAWRKRLSERFSRGTVALTLHLNDHRSVSAPSMNQAALEAALAAAQQAQTLADAAGLALAPLSLHGLLGLRGVFDAENGDRGRPSEELTAAIGADLDRALAALAGSRIEEGARLASILGRLMDEIGTLAGRAATLAEARNETAADRLRDRVTQILESGAPLDESRLAQELALITVKWDVREELDRLGAHIASARALLAAREPVGRKLDFLIQEFNREANTLCAKSQDPALTEIGLALKVAIDQFREQIANVE